MKADEDEMFRGEMRLAEYDRLSHGLHLKRRSDLTEDEEFRRELHAYQLVLPPSAVFTHLTAARLLGWQLPKLPEQVPVFVAVDGNDRRPRRHGVICSRLVRKRDPTRRAADLPVDSAEEILLRCARDLGVLDLVILIDSARKCGDLDDDRMEALLLSRRPGVRLLRIAYRLSSHRAESGGESVLRMFHEAIDVPVEPQVELFDGRGTSVGRADLLVTGTSFVHEYDGAHHRDKLQHRTDLRRERGLVGTSYVRRGFTLDDLLNHPGVVMHEIDRALDRAHLPRRLGLWRQIVANSLYSDQGRERVMNRWRRRSGIVDWTRTA
jgi:hypothetical protein